MTQYISKSALAAEIERMLQNEYACEISQEEMGYHCALHELKSFLDTLEVKEVDLMIHTIITECCDWLTICTDLSHDLIENCRNLMLAVKDEQLKAQKGE